MARSRSPGRRDRRHSRSRSRSPARRRDRDDNRERSRRDPDPERNRRDEGRDDERRRIPRDEGREPEHAAEDRVSNHSWAQRIGDPRYDGGGDRKGPESDLWSKKGKSGNLWENRNEAAPVLIGTGREEAADVPMSQRKFDSGAVPASVLAMEAIAVKLSKQDDPEDDDQEESEEDEVSGEAEEDEDEDDGPEKEEVNFGNTGLLAAETNTINGVVVKFQVPPEARLPTKRWRLYIFKGDEVIEPLKLHRMNHYLIGRERKVCHIPSDNPSVSSQHAVICFRLVEKPKTKSGLEKIQVVVPYLMDLGSVNGTYLNNKKVDSQRFIELMEGDALQFGTSARKYVLLHEETNLAKKRKKK